MDDRQRTTMKRLLDRLLATRARRDREVRLSPPWRAADEELRAIEHAIFRVPLDDPSPAAGPTSRPRRVVARVGRHLRRAATVARTRAIEGQRAG